MEMLSGSVGWASMVNEYGTFHLSRLKAEPKAKAQAEAFSARQDALEAKGNAFVRSERAVAAFEAAMAKNDFDMDNLVKELYFSKLAACGNNKKDKAFLRWFKGGLSDITRQPFDAEVAKIAALISILAETPDDPLAAQFIPRLKAMLEAYRGALETLRSVISASANAWALLEAEKINWLGAYRKDYADLLSIYDGDKHSADSFFKKASKPKKGNGEASPVKPPAPKA